MPFVFLRRKLLLLSIFLLSFSLWSQIKVNGKSDELRVKYVKMSSPIYSDYYNPNEPNPAVHGEKLNWLNFVRVYKKTGEISNVRLEVRIEKNVPTAEFPESIKMISTLDRTSQFIREKQQELYSKANTEELDQLVEDYIKVADNISSDPFLAQRTSSPVLQEELYKVTDIRMTFSDEKQALYALDLQISEEQVAHLFFLDPRFQTIPFYSDSRSHVLRVNVSDEVNRRLHGGAIDPVTTFAKTVDNKKDATTLPLLNRDKANELALDPNVTEQTIIKEEELFEYKHIRSPVESGFFSGYIKIPSYSELVPRIREMQGRTGINALYILPPTEYSGYNYQFENNVKIITVVNRDGTQRKLVIGSDAIDGEGQNISRLRDKVIVFNVTGTRYSRLQGGDSEFARFLEEVEKMGIQVIIDVPWFNHTASEGFTLYVSRETDRIIDAFLKYYGYRREVPYKPINILADNAIDLKTGARVPFYGLFYALKEDLSPKGLPDPEDYPKSMGDIATAPFRRDAKPPKWTGLRQIDHRRSLVNLVLAQALFDMLKRVNPDFDAIGMRDDVFHVYPDQYEEYSSTTYMTNFMKAFFKRFTVVAEIAGEDVTENSIAWKSGFADVVQGPTYLQLAGKDFRNFQGYIWFKRYLALAARKTPIMSTLANHDTNSANQTPGLNQRYMSAGQQMGYGGDFRGVVGAFSALGMDYEYFNWFYWGDETGLEKDRDPTLVVSGSPTLVYEDWNISKDSKELTPIFDRAKQIKDFLWENKFGARNKKIEFRLETDGKLMAEGYMSEKGSVIVLWNMSETTYDINLEVPSILLSKMSTDRLYDLMNFYNDLKENGTGGLSALEKINLQEGRIKREMRPYEVLVITDLDDWQVSKLANEIIASTLSEEKLKTFGEKGVVKPVANEKQVVQPKVRTIDDYLEGELKAEDITRLVNEGMIENHLEFATTYREVLKLEALLEKIFYSGIELTELQAEKLDGIKNKIEQKKAADVDASYETPFADSRSRILAYIGETSGSDREITEKFLSKMSDEMEANNGLLTRESLSVIARPEVLDLMITASESMTESYNLLVQFKGVFEISEAGRYRLDYYNKPGFEELRRGLREYRIRLK